MPATCECAAVVFAHHLPTHTLQHTRLLPPISDPLMPYNCVISKAHSCFVHKFCCRFRKLTTSSFTRSRCIACSAKNRPVLISQKLIKEYNLMTSTYKNQKTYLSSCEWSKYRGSKFLQEKTNARILCQRFVSLSVFQSVANLTSIISGMAE